MHYFSTAKKNIEFSWAVFCVIHSCNSNFIVNCKYIFLATAKPFLNFKKCIYKRTHILV